MKTSRLEAFSERVLAIIITIMVLGLQMPEGGGTFENLRPLIPKFLSYIISFIYVGIYWNNHHHLFQIMEKVNGKILWANLALLLWLSVLPFATAWMGDYNFAKNTVAVYGFVLLMCAAAFNTIEHFAVKNDGPESALANALNQKKKEYISLALYMSGIILSFFYPKLGLLLYFIVALLWLIPDQRVEKKLN